MIDDLKSFETKQDPMLFSSYVGTLTLKSIPCNKFEEVVKALHRGGFEIDSDKLFQPFMSLSAARDFCSGMDGGSWKKLTNIDYLTGVNLSRCLNLLGCASSFETTFK